jgi:hypothetical protein
MSQFQDYCDRLRAKYGDKFTDIGLAQKFRPYFRGQRIKVRFSYGETKTGTVGGTTGWQPSLMLMLTKRSLGSSHLLSDRDEIIAVQNYGDKGYRSI